MAKEKRARIRNVKDSTENWEKANPILLDGEIGFEVRSDGSVAIKIGDGKTAWKLLKYITKTAKEADAGNQYLQDQIDNIVVASSADGGDVSAEVAQARVSIDGTNFGTLKDRLDADQNALAIEIGRVETDILSVREDLNEWKLDKATVKKIDADFSIAGCIRASDGTLNPDIGDTKTTGLVCIKGATSISVCGSITSAYCVVAFYDADKNYLPNLSVIGTNRLETVEIDLTSDIYSPVCYASASHYGDSTEPYFKTTGIIDVNEVANIIPIVENIIIDVNALETDINDLENVVTGTICDFDEVGYIKFEDGTISGTNIELAKNTGFVNISNITRIEVDSTISTSGALVAFYDADKNYLKDISIVGAGAPKYLDIDLTKPEYHIAKFVIVSKYDRDDELLRLYGLVDHITKINDDISLLSANSVEINNIVPKKVSPVEEGFIKYSTGTTAYTTGCVNTGFVYVKGASKIKARGAINSTGALLAFFDKNKQYLKNISIQGDNTVTEVTIDLTNSLYSDVVYAVVSKYGTTESYLQLIPMFSQQSESVLDNTQVLIFGDSITDCCSFSISDDKTTSYAFRNPSYQYTDAQGNVIPYSAWAKILRDTENCTEIRNYAKSGAMYKTMSRESGNERQNLQYQIDVAINDKNNPNNVFSVNSFEPNIIVFALGTNDGTPSDDYETAMAVTSYRSDGVSIDYDATIDLLDDTKFCQSARKAFMRVKREFPMAQIYCVLPIQRSINETNFDKLNDELRKMARRYGCIIIDGVSESGIVRDFEEKSTNGYYLRDGLHPNDKGQNMMARMIITSMKSHYCPYRNGYNV